MHFFGWDSLRPRTEVSYIIGTIPTIHTYSQPFASFPDTELARITHASSF